MSTVATPMSDQSPKTNKVAENGSSREESRRPDDGGHNGNATPRLAERMGLTSRNDTSGDGRDRQSRLMQPEGALNRNGSHASAIESLTLRTDRDPPPHSSRELRHASRDSASTRSHTHEKPAEDRKQVRLPYVPLHSQCFSSPCIIRRSRFPARALLLKLHYHHASELSSTQIHLGASPSRIHPLPKLSIDPRSYLRSPDRLIESVRTKVGWLQEEVDNRSVTDWMSYGREHK
jgi:hypothetical protein